MRDALTLVPLEPRDALSGTVTDYPRDAYLAASGRYAGFDLPEPRADQLAALDSLPGGSRWTPAGVSVPPYRAGQSAAPSVRASPDSPPALNRLREDAGAGPLALAWRAAALLPQSVWDRLASAGVTLTVFGGSLTALPEFAALAGVPTGRVSDSRAYDAALGVYDVATRRAYASVDAPPETCLHEFAHADYYAGWTDGQRAGWQSLSAAGVFRDSDPYEAGNADEAQAECERRYLDGSRANPPGVDEFLAPILGPKPRGAAG